MSDEFFPELASENRIPRMRLVQGVLFELEHALAYRSSPLEQLMTQGARNAESYMRARGMKLPDEFWKNIVEARLFAYEKSEEEVEEHIADDAMSFLLQFFGYPASEMDPDVLRQAVDVFYAPEMTAWRLYPHAIETLETLNEEGYRLGIVANASCDRVLQRTVDYLGLRPYLDLCITSAGVEYRKPDKAIFELVVDQWDVMPYELVIVGPSLKHDVAAAIELGAQAVMTRIQPEGPSSLYDDPGIAVSADAVIDSLAELPALVADWATV
ncbi:MAG: HAD family hydrolase [Caldilineaceae bacterium]